MKFPKLRHAGLCNILIFLSALFLFLPSASISRCYVL